MATGKLIPILVIRLSHGREELVAVSRAVCLTRTVTAPESAPRLSIPVIFLLNLNADSLGSIWKLEYRLHALWIPSLIFNPIGLGLFGAGLQYHLSWVVLALGQVFVTFGSLAITPNIVNYINECFIHNTAEASIAVNLFRVGFGLSVAFYIKQWEQLSRWVGRMA
jgi:hypothetical protein